ncbi:hypothetical protein ACS0TY_005934 [Phlomoides rotata]
MMKDGDFKILKINILRMKHRLTITATWVQMTSVGMLIKGNKQMVYQEHYIIDLNILLEIISLLVKLVINLKLNKFGIS